MYRHPGIHGAEAEGHDPEYQYYPNSWFEPYQSRRRASGFGLYEALGIDRNDLQARERQNLRNLHFFDAPIGLLIDLIADSIPAAT